MGWLTKKFDQWASSKQREELTRFIDMLRSMDGAELGHVVALATHLRHGLEDEGHNVMDPIVYTAQNVTFALFLSRTSIQLQKKQQTQEAAGMMIWLHTVRAAIRLELRSLGRDMWRQLERGFPYVEESALHFRQLSGVWLNISDARQFPAGLSPEPE